MHNKQMVLHLDEDGALDAVWRTWDAALQMTIARAYAKPLAVAARAAHGELVEESEDADEE